MGKAGVLMSIPFTLLVTIGAGFYGGQWIDQHYATRYGNFIGVLLGFGIGLYEVLQQLKQLEKKKRG